MIRRFVAVATVLVFAMNGLLFAGLDTGADFLKIPVGARGVGLGMANTASSSGVEALSGNPAGMTAFSPAERSLNNGFSFSHQQILEENNLDYMGLNLPTASRRTSWGFSFTRLSYADQERRDANRANTGSLTANDMALGLAWAHQASSLRMGVHFKGIRQQLANETAQGFAVDLGLMGNTGVKGLSVGASLLNAGPSMTFVRESFKLPLTMAIGSAYQLSQPVSVSMDVRHRPNSRQTTASFGAEFTPGQAVAFRTGYLAKLAESITNNQKSESDRGTFSGVSGLSMGLGIVLAQMHLDYAITPFGELGNNHVFTISSNFGGTDEPRSQTIDTPTKEQPAREERSIISFPSSTPPEQWWPSQP